MSFFQNMSVTNVAKIHKKINDLMFFIAIFIVVYFDYKNIKKSFLALKAAAC